MIMKWSFGRGVLHALALLVFVLAVFASNVGAEQVEFEFDHLATGFDLSGAHARLKCEQCHVRGVLSGTPKLCNQCHSLGSEVSASTKSPYHLPTEAQCGECHTDVSWFVGVDFSHSADVVGRCMLCHNGVRLPGKNAGHLPTTNHCEGCHSPQSTWDHVLKVDHAELNSSVCLNCHNGVKPQTHPNTTNLCDSCHLTTAWLPLSRLDHDELINPSCVSCHDGVNERGKEAGHLVTSGECSGCHSTVAWVPANLVYHTFVLACFDCHNNIDEIGKGVSHPVTGNTCEDCHYVSTWTAITPDAPLQSSLAMKAVAAAAPPVISASLRSVATMAVAAGSSPLAIQSATTVDHLDVSGTCADCHGRGDAKGRPVSHLGSTDKCDSCHITSAWKPAVVDHQETDGECISCHDGAKAQGMGSNHPDRNDSCGLCHATSAWTPAGEVAPALATDSRVALAAFDHSRISGTCIACHNGIAAPGKNATHLRATNVCDSCHSDNTWKPAVTVDHFEVSGACVGCHNSGGAASAKTPAHLRSTDNCDSCHNTQTWTTVTVVDHLEVNGSCANCHNGINAGGRSPTHIRTGGECDNCHVTNAWKPAVMDHMSISDPCFNCHNAAMAGGKPSAHIPSTNHCDGCHTTNAWIPARTDHDELAGAPSCATCHSAVMPHYSGDCRQCHSASPATWRVNRYSHNGGNHPDSTCSSCHLGNSSQTLPVTGQPCVGCHAPADHPEGDDDHDDHH